MAKSTPVIASHVNTSLRNLLAILTAGGARDGEIELDGYVWPQSAKRQLLDGKLKAIKDSDGEVVAYKRVAQAQHKDGEEEWRKTPSAAVHTMQLKRGKRGRRLPACHRREYGGDMRNLPESQRPFAAHVFVNQ